MSPDSPYWQIDISAATLMAPLFLTHFRSTLMTGNRIATGGSDLFLRIEALYWDRASQSSEKKNKEKSDSHGNQAD